MFLLLLQVVSLLCSSLMALKDWCVKYGFAEDIYLAAHDLGLEEPSDLAYVFASQAEAEQAGRGAP